MLRPFNSMFDAKEILRQGSFNLRKFVYNYIALPIINTVYTLRLMLYACKR